MKVLKTFVDCTLALIALINPISKIFVISTLSEQAAGIGIQMMLDGIEYIGGL